MKNKCKQTLIGKIPDDWEEEQLNEVLSDIILGQAPPSSSYNKKGLGVPLVKASEFGKTTPKIVIWTNEPVQRGCVEDIFLSIAGTIGLVNYGIDSAIGRSVAALRPNSEINKDFLFYLLKYKSRKLIGQGSTQKIITKPDIKKIKFLKPPLPEQRSIASVLSTVDEAIQKSRDIIKKTERLKKGLMRKLLTKGIGHNKFKKAKIGPRYYDIPEDWEVEKLGNIFSFIRTYPFPRSYLHEGQDKEDIYYIHYGDIHAKFSNLILDFDVEKIPVLKNNEIIKNNNSFLEDGDLVIVDASEDYLGVGECVELKNIKDRRVVAGLHTFALRDEKQKTSLSFRGYLLKNYITRRELRKNATGFSVFGISKLTLSNLDLIIPPSQEQQKIALILLTVDKKIKLENKRKNKLERIKKGLMDDLLTGRKRVKVGG